MGLENARMEVTGLRVRRAMAPVRRTLATRVGTFTQGPFLLLDLELKGGGAGHALCFTFIPLGLKVRSEEHTSELQAPCKLVCRLLLEKKNR